MAPSTIACDMTESEDRTTTEHHTDGRWGEVIRGRGEDVAQAELEFQELRPELSRASRISPFTSAQLQGRENHLEKQSSDIGQ
ncbi:hypothetical protein V1522DRAFT_250219 [Lipomyces starkeyi]